MSVSSLPLTLHEARSPECLIFECIAGSRAYGTDTPESDIDLRGVFVMPRQMLFGLGHVEQVSDDTNDETYYEIGRFVELLCRNNPNIIEMIYSVEACTRFRHPLFDLLKPEIFLSKLCQQTFGGYAMTQVSKARGLNKKIVKPMEGERKGLPHFCHILRGQGSIPLEDWLAEQGVSQSDCGLVKVPHMRDVYGLYLPNEGGNRYRGILTKETSTEVACSSVPLDAEPTAWMSFNRDGYKKYCRQYREYQEWLENRNEARYRTNAEHGRGYDSKNLMHTFRLLDMAREIATEGRITVRVKNRDWLMRVRAGEFAYEDLLRMAEERISEIDELFARSDLPERADRERANEALIEIRDGFYS